jgi:hypothetical protein
MSAKGRPEREYRSAKREGSPVSETGEAKGKVHNLARGAEPRPAGRVRERGWRSTSSAHGIDASHGEAARRRAIAATDTLIPLQPRWDEEVAK